ncbi:MAG: hypothetical protein WEB87_05495 [Bacteriovoracaceae bacterium]
MKNVKIMGVMVLTLVFNYACDTDNPKRGLIDRPLDRADEASLQQEVERSGDNRFDKGSTGSDWQQLRNYAYQQKEKALQEYRAALDSLDNKIDKLEVKIETQSEEIEHDTRQTWMQTSENLKERRAQLAKNFQDLKNASKEEWNQLQASFESNWNSLKDKWEGVQAE